MDVFRPGAPPHQMRSGGEAPPEKTARERPDGEVGALVDVGHADEHHAHPRQIAPGAPEVGAGHPGQRRGDRDMGRGKRELLRLRHPYTQLRE